MKADFKKVLVSLNDDQRLAVEAVEGPLLVLAGPGTGKTQLLSARAANILATTDAGPENILCLTFTDKAATNMQERMLDLIGPDARKIAVHTFHGLGAEIINSNPDYFWNGAKLEPAPEAVKLELIENILSKLPLDNPLSLKFAGQFTLVSDVAKAIQCAKEAGLTPGKLKAITAANLSYIDLVEPALQPVLEQTITKARVNDLGKVINDLPDEPTGKIIAPIPPLSQVLKHSFTTALAEHQTSGQTKAITNWKNIWTEVKQGRRVLKDRARNNWWQELAAVYGLYDQEMNRRHYFDFADMILETITQLEGQESLRTELQERFTYIMIDEFQDTNDAQFRLSYLIANHPAHEGRPNIMAVGDDDQAIYRFQGAELSNVQTFMDSFKDTKKVVLKESYRSHQSVIDSAATVAEKIDKRLVDELPGLDKNIQSAVGIQAGQIEHISYPTKAHQLTDVALRIKTASQAGHVAVVARSHKSLENLAAVLTNQLNVPIRYERRSNILEHEAVTLICDMLNLLQAIGEGNKDLANQIITGTMAHPMWEIKPEDLWKLAVSQRHRPNWLTALAEHKQKNFKMVADWWLKLNQLASHQPLPVIMEHLLGLRELDDFVSPVRQYYLDKKAITNSYVEAVSALQHLRQLAADYSRSRQATLSSFNSFIRLNKEHGVVIADENVYSNAATETVELLTVHKAKGLEFDHVFIIDAVDNDWKPGRNRRKPPLNLESLQTPGETADDYARLLYVAVTRAKRHLTISTYRQNDEGRTVLPSPLLRDIASVTTLEAQDCSDPWEVAEQNFVWPELNQSDARLALKSVLDEYELPVTSLLNFLDITTAGPQYFLVRNLLRLPEVKKPRLAFGTAVHEALKVAQLLTNQKKLSSEPVIEAFREQLTKEMLPPEEEERYLSHGELLLKRLLDWESFELPPASLPERTIKHVRIGQATIQGNLDRLDEIIEGWHVVDYKTGQPLKGQLTSQTKTEGVKAWKHRRQLTFYALLLKEAGIADQKQSITASMVYLEAEEAKNLHRSYTPSAEDLQHLSKLIQAVWQRIHKLDLPDISGYTKDLAGIEQFESDLIEGKI